MNKNIEYPIDIIPNITDTTLIGAWLNKGVKGTARDLANKLNATNTKAVFNKIGATFNGTNSVISTSGNSGISGNANFTMSAWIKPITLTDYAGIVSWGNTGVAGQLAALIVMANGQVGLATAGAQNALVASSTITNGKWYYITITKTAGALNTTTKVYVNGIDTALSSPNTSTPNITNAKIEIGSITSVSYYFKGLIKDVRVYNEVKNASWVWNEYLKSNPETDLLFATQNGEKDLSIYKRTITNTNNVPVGKTMRFDTSKTQSLNITDIGDINNASHTISLWAKRLSVDNIFTYIGKLGTSTYEFSLDSFSAGGIEYNSWQNGGGGHVSFSSATSPIKNTKWQHIVYTADYTNNIFTIYVDGINIASSTTKTGTMVNRANAVIVGASYNNAANNYATGEIADVRIYNATKSANWVKDYYLKTRSNY